MPVNNQYDHGTNVAGCVSASTNNGTGIASVGWSVKLMGINSTDDPGFVTDGYSGILAAGQMGADVINLSWGGFGGGNQSVINQFTIIMDVSLLQVQVTEMIMVILTLTFILPQG